MFFPIKVCSERRKKCLSCDLTEAERSCECRISLLKKLEYKKKKKKKNIFLELEEIIEETCLLNLCLPTILRHISRPIKLGQARCAR